MLNTNVCLDKFYNQMCNHLSNVDEQDKTLQRFGYISLQQQIFDTWTDEMSDISSKPFLHL